jgi:molybdate transport system substrate-binding protein
MKVGLIMKNIICFLLAVSVVAVMAGCSTAKTSKSSSSAPAKSVELTIAAAASLTDVTAQIAKDYKAVAPNVKLTFSYGASGTLETQIEQGAPVDIFMSAAEKQMDGLSDKGLLAAGTRTDLLHNKAVLIVPKGSTLGITSFTDLGTSKVKKIAIGDPASVPAGQYAQDVFTSLKIWDTVKAKANLGTDVRQVLTWVEDGDVDCGVVYATDAATSTKITVICDAPAGSSEPIVYPVAVIKASKNVQAAQAFINYLKSSAAASRFTQAGFTMA